MNRFDINFSDGNFASKESFAAWNIMWEAETTYHEWVPESHTNDGTGCLRIRHEDRAHSASHISQKVTLVKDAKYKISGYVKFDNIISTTANGNGGAYCTLGDSYIGKYTHLDVPYSADWTYFETFYTATYTGEFTFSCRIWGAVGTAYFDDIEIVLIEECDPEVLKHWAADEDVRLTEDGFTLVAIGDPQAAVSDDVQQGTSHFADGVKEIISKKDSWNIQYVMNMGDVTDVSSDLEQWQIAKDGHKLFRDAGMKYSIAFGNHDYEQFVGLRSGVVIDRRTNNFRTYFPASDYYEWLGNEDFGTYDGTMMDTFHKFTYDGHKYMIIALEFAPTEDTVRWAKDLCDANPDCHVIFTVHCLFSPRGRVAFREEQNSHIVDGMLSSYMWNNLVSACPNIFLACCGHCDCHGVASYVTYGKSGNLITSIVVNPQGTLGGSEMMTAFIRITNVTDVTCYAYSPSVKKFYAGSNFRFDMLNAGKMSGDTVILDKNFSGKLFEHVILDKAVVSREYSSSDENVVKVSEDGTVTACGCGCSTVECFMITAQSAYAKNGPGARIRVEIKVCVE